MSDPADGGDARELQSIRTAIKNEGFATANIGDLVSKLHETLASLKKAEEARDKFAAANDEASKIIGAKGAEKGELLQQIKALEAERDELKAKMETGISPVETPKSQQPQPPAPPAKSVEEQLDAIEDSLTEEQWGQLGELIKAVDDVDDAVAIDKVPERRLQFIREFKQLQPKEKPTAFTPRKKATSTPAPTGETQVEQLMKKVFGVAHGPSGRVPVGRPFDHTTQPRTDPRLK